MSAWCIFRHDTQMDRVKCVLRSVCGLMRQSIRQINKKTSRIGEQLVDLLPFKKKNLHNKVVLVRWWTAPGCPYCVATAPALNEFYKSYHRKGLEVVGFYHHKSTEPLNVKFNCGD